jgi:hypothetical protein
VSPVPPRALLFVLYVAALSVPVVIFTEGVVRALLLLAVLLSAWIAAVYVERFR